MTEKISTPKHIIINNWKNLSEGIHLHSRIDTEKHYTLKKDFILVNTYIVRREKT